MKTVRAFNWLSFPRLGTGIFVLVLLVAFVLLVRATVRAWHIQGNAALMCSTPFVFGRPLSYIQYNIKEQSTEPLFVGSVFVSLGDVATGPEHGEIQISAGNTNPAATVHLDLFRDEPNKTFWMRKEQDASFLRQTGTARDFPFDSTVINVDTTFKPPLPLHGFILRNFNASFYLPCDSVTWAVTNPDKLHLRFEMRRNPLVQLMAVVIFGTAALFTLVIPFGVKREAMPTAVASFFFSVWSIRGILGSEMRVFPTRLDIGILFLCVLLLLLISTRVLWWWIKSAK
jgi:hypothetical protein